MKVEFKNLYIHFVFTTLHREPLISEEFRERLEKYITGVVNNRGCQLYAIYANPEHVHLLVSIVPDISVENLANIVSDISERFINSNKFCKFQFKWQENCSAFSVSKGHVDKVCKYILNQKEHHKTKTFIEEYEEFIKFFQKTLIPK